MQKNTFVTFFEKKKRKKDFKTMWFLAAKKFSISNPTYFVEFMSKFFQL